MIAAVKATDLVETLEGKSTFAVFAPTNEAFEKLPAGTVETPQKPENKKALKGMLTCPVVAGNLYVKTVLAAIKKGKVTFTALQTSKQAMA